MGGHKHRPVVDVVRSWRTLWRKRYWVVCETEACPAPPRHGPIKSYALAWHDADWLEDNSLLQTEDV
jgi:hypothetical protein